MANTIELSEILNGVRIREKELHNTYLSFLEKQKDKKQTDRYDAFYTAYGLFGDCIDSPHLTKLTHVEQYIKRIKQYLSDTDLKELRALFELLADNEIIAVGDVLGGKMIEEIKQ